MGASDDETAGVAVKTDGVGGALVGDAPPVGVSLKVLLRDELTDADGVVLAATDAVFALGVPDTDMQLAD